MTEQIRVVFFHSATDTFSGGAKMLYRLLTGLDKDRFEPIVLTQAEDELTRRLNEEGIRVEIVPPKGVLRKYDQRMMQLPLHRKLSLIGRILQYNTDAYSILEEADIVWCENTRSIITLLPYGAFSDIPFIWNVGLGQRSTGLMKYIQLVALQIVDQIFIESEEQAYRIFSDKYEYFDDKFTIFSKGIDTEKFRPSLGNLSNAHIDTKIESPAIGTAATITPRKGLNNLIRAFQIVHTQYPTTNLYIAGDTSNDIHQSYESELYELISDLGLSESVHFLGWVEDMPSYLSKLDVFVLSSYNEGISGAVREAMAMELPVICSDVGGMSDLITDHENGLLIPPGNEAKIAGSVETILENPDLGKQFGKRARDTIRTSYSIDNYISEYERFLYNVYKNT